jgi:phosphoribosylformylglycinamidine cyclo-ligase
LQQILKKVKPTGLAHITGGGLPGNVARVLPNNTQAVIQKGSWDVPPVFGYLQRLGDVAEDEMFRVFNMGIGFTIIVRPKHVVACLKAIKKAGHTGWEIGTIEKGKGGVVLQ